ncbi:FAD-dependent oxidoreductase [Pseudonocardia sp. CA-107938]|uniref:FAD-dependent oxidoreductase n=1 Tax=Pseudonocardia sp. CA-107938 TaxID=3240021 RepID=UPI003D943DDE
MSTPHVTVVGAGPGGLVLAVLLHRAGVPVTVYERDAGPAARDQGGTLDLHVPSGQLALREAGLEARFRAVARGEGQDMVLLDSAGTVLVRAVTPDDAPLARPEIDRSALRDLLLGALPDDVVQWGRRCLAAQPRPGGGHRLNLTGAAVETDLLVGADGANSRVRPLLTDVEPRYSGVTMIEMSIPDADRTAPAVAAAVGRGSYWALGECRCLAAQRNGDGTIRVYLSDALPQDWADTCGIPFDDPDTARPMLVDRFLDGWAPEHAALVMATSGPIAVRPREVLPVGLRWAPRPDVTLIGDAAHLMPSAGEGANQAMLDALLLSRALVEQPDVASALRVYEEEMFPRTAAIAAEGTRIHDMILGPTAAQDLARFFRGAAA